MAARVEKKFTVADVYQEAAKMLRQEMRALKQRELNKNEEVQTEKLARALSNNVLKEMKII